MYVSLLRDFPRRHDSLILLHSVQITSKPKFLACFAAIVDEPIVQVLQLCASGGKVVGDAFTEGIEGISVAFHMTEVCICGGLIHFQWGVRSHRYWRQFQDTSGIWLGRVSR